MVGAARGGCGGDGAGTLVAVMSCTSHFILGRWRRFLSIISLMTVRLKSMFVMSVQPAWSYLSPGRCDMSSFAAVLPCACSYTHDSQHCLSSICKATCKAGYDVAMCVSPQQSFCLKQGLPWVASARHSVTWSRLHITSCCNTSKLCTCSCKTEARQ